MPRKSRSKHPHDPFPENFDQWVDSAVWAIIILGYLFVIGEICRYTGIT